MPRPIKKKKSASAPKRSFKKSSSSRLAKKLPRSKSGVRTKTGLRTKPKKATPKVVTPAPNEEALKLARSMANALEEKKAEDVVILDVRGRSSYTDYLVVASGESDVQLRAMANGVHEKLKANGRRPLSWEGDSGANWVLLDYGDVVGHFFDSATRSFYDLEGMWADAPRES
jgi:ribosome-associated protein